VVRRITRIGVVEGNGFPPQQKTALVSTRLLFVFGYCFVSAVELSNAPAVPDPGTFAMIQTFQSCFYPTSVSLKAV